MNKKLSYPDSISYFRHDKDKFTHEVNFFHVRFGLSSTQTGLIASMNDIINISLVLFLGYLGRKLNKPRCVL